MFYFHFQLIAVILLAKKNPVWDYLHRIATPDKFHDVYQLNRFDLLVMIPYFVVLIVLAMYGLHRYKLVYDYFKFRQNVPPRLPPLEGENVPGVTIQLPIYNERYVIERLVEAVSRMDYPRDRLEIQVLDDSTDETQRVAATVVERYRALGVPIRYYHRNHREGFKAGALREGLKVASGEFIAVFDADFLPPPDFLRRLLPYFSDPKIAMVQTRWSYINREYSLLTQVETMLLDGHFVIEHGARSRSGCFFNFNGTGGVWRRSAIEDAGGWEHDTLTEDTDLSYRAQMKGWKFAYLPEVECPSELPVEMNAFKAQQARWAKGLMQTAKKILPRLLRSKLPWRVKAEAVFHLTANISYPFMIVLSTLLLPAMIVRFYQGMFQVLVIDLPLFLASTMSISTFYLASQRELDPKGWKRAIVYLPFLMAIGIGLCVQNAKAVLGAIFGVQSEFARTPKYRIESGQDTWTGKLYRNRAGLLPLVEIAIGLYFVFTVYYAFENENYATVPFLLLFVWGYLYTGFLSLAQIYLERFRLVRPLRVARASATGAAGF